MKIGEIMIENGENITQQIERKRENIVIIYCYTDGAHWGEVYTFL